jgi:hypothetical protein
MTFDRVRIYDDDALLLRDDSIKTHVSLNIVLPALKLQG